MHEIEMTGKIRARAQYGIGEYQHINETQDIEHFGISYCVQVNWR